jgi:Pyruvate/2-oxoglutarate dehydrogenase complex, dehydrogenase (E1) component, eukaryotic type, alpha subunit
MFRRANFSHHFELMLKKVFDNGNLKLPIYLALGTEFNSAALSMVLKGYNIFAQHRGHALYLNFGGPPEELRDELLGLPSGCSGGMSGSNAIQCPEIKMFGHSGLMGEQIPIAVGAAYASNEPTLAICGDASVEEDYVYPSLGFIATKKLPVLVICEDNDLSILTKMDVRRSWNVVDIASSVGIPAVDISDDPWLIAHHAHEMAQNLPGFINIRSVRHLWHAGTGTDGKPEWNRYQLVLNELEKLGLSKQANQIDKENYLKADLIWEEQLQKQ